MKVLIVGDFYANNKQKFINQSPKEIFGNFYETINNADLAIVNMESPLTCHEYPIKKTGPALKGDKYFASFLKQTGFNLATLANNHIMDFGEKGLIDTLNTLNENKLPFVGAGLNLWEACKPFIYTDKNGVKLAVLNFAENEWSTSKGSKPGAVGVDLINNYRSIQEVKTVVDYILIVTHGGHEHYGLPSPELKKLLRFYVDAGADAIVNHHTHHLSGFEIYRGRPIYYSLGNFLFENSRINNSYWNKGMAVEINFSNNKIESDFFLFEQFKNENLFHLITGNAFEIEKQEILIKNEIIQNDALLNKNFEDWVKTSTLYYNINIEPHTSRILQALQNRNILPSFWSKRKKLFLLNMLRCESHRELLVKLLENEVSHTQ